MNEKYQIFYKIGVDSFKNNVNRIGNKKTGNYYAMIIIKKTNIKNINENTLVQRVDEISKLNTENNICIQKNKITDNNLQIVMDFCEYNLEDYLNYEINTINLNEIKEILNQLNKVFKKMYENQIINEYLSTKKIFISFNRLDKSLIILSFYSSSIPKMDNKPLKIDTLLSMAPEVLNDKEIISFKRDIWSLGIIIYYMLFKEYLFKGKNEYKISNNNNSNKKLKLIDDKELNDLLKKKLGINEKDRITWEENFNHSFFNLEKANKSINFDFKCEKLFQNNNYNSKFCKKNNCREEHLNHQLEIKQANNNEKKNINHNSLFKKRNYGFENIMNDCFMNASLQLLTHEESLIEEIININESKINKNTPGKGKLILEFKKLIDEINKNKKLINPRGVKTIMGLIDKKYKTEEQQDSNEFINTFLMEIHDEINQPRESKPFNIPKNNEEREVYLNFWNKFYKKNNSFIIDLFHGIFKDEVKCIKNHKLNIKFRIFNMIELPIIEFISNDKIYLNDILNQFFREKNFNKTKNCPECKTTNNYYRKTSIYSLPPLLLLFFNRVVDDKYYYNNIIYDEKLKINDLIKGENNYQLIGLIEHRGSANSGHYTAICNNNYSWYKYNEQSYYKINNIQSENAIILLYKRK